MTDALLDAVALFLERELKGQVADPRLAFRVLIAAHLTSTVAAELRVEEPNDAAELAGLRALLGDQARDQPADRSTRRAELERLNRELGARLRDGRLAVDDPAALTHLQDTLARRLRIVSPRFDLRPDID